MIYGLTGGYKMSLSGKIRIRIADGTNKEIKNLYIGNMISSKD